jgi:hypothetical protein
MHPATVCQAFEDGWSTVPVGEYRETQMRQDPQSWMLMLINDPMLFFSPKHTATLCFYDRALVRSQGMLSGRATQLAHAAGDSVSSESELVCARKAQEHCVVCFTANSGSGTCVLTID